MKKKIIIRSILVVLATLLATVTLLLAGVGLPATAAEDTLKYTDELGELMEQASSFVVVYHKQMGGSHYAYTEAVSDHLNDGRQWGGDSGIESNWNPGSKMTLVTLKRDGDKVIKTEKRIENSTGGVLRDPCVSEDGTKVVFSWKKSAQDDYHLYEYTFATQKTVQLTFGSGVADIEPVYTANGNIVFNSTRDIQTVDCWHTDVSNLYTCNADGSNITRLGYDQIHTTYPTTTSDGRILYTRWDYNDRSQMYVQSVFQMFQDGTLQTEVFGNNSSNPTTLLHTREIPNTPGKYVAIVSGHHTHQVGKLLTVDTTIDRNNKSALKYVWTDNATNALQNSHDNDTGHYYDGKVFKYPVAITDDIFLVSSHDDGYVGRDTPFNIELVYGRNKSQVIVEGSNNFPASQVSLVKNSPQFNRASLVNYNSNYGTYYVGNVYEGDSMKGVQVGTVKYLRVVALEFRSSAIGATIGRGTGGSDPYSPIATGNGSWDVKKVLGIVDVHPDGSALFTAPSETPLYFQLLDKNGDMIQTMRSWSTLQPGEYFSCVGCHEDKNIAPPVQSKITDAMKAGAQKLRPDLWMKEVESYEKLDAYDSSTVQGFDYLDVVQPILDANCISCHSNSKTSYDKIRASEMSRADLTAADVVVSKRDEWSFTTTAPSGSWTSPSFNSSSWESASAPFGKIGTAPGMVNTVWKSSGSIWLRKTVTLTQYDLEKCAILMNLAYTDKIEVYVNGTKIYTGNSAVSDYTAVEFNSAARAACKVGENTIAVKVTAGSDGQFFDLELRAGTNLGATTTLVPSKSNWKTKVSATEDITGTAWTKVGYSTTGWKTAAAPLGGRLGGHGNLSEAEIQAIACWIDLCIPCFGSYYSREAWDGNDVREYEEELHKRELYDSIDRWMKLDRAGATKGTGEIKLEYITAKNKTYSATGEGMVILYTTAKYSANDKIVITLPKGEKYLAMSLNSRVGEAIIYCPSGKFTYTMPNTGSIFPNTMDPGSGINYQSQTITARVVTAEELAKKHNLALNPYDLTSASGSYPHASTSNVNDKNLYWEARCAIDGFTANEGHGEYPYQSWGPNDNVKATDHFTIDFGREVTVDELVVVIRADFPHDSYFTGCTVTFSDGTSKQINLTNSALEQVIDLGGVKTSSIKLSGFTVETAGATTPYAALTEVKVMGTEVKK